MTDVAEAYSDVNLVSEKLRSGISRRVNSFSFFVDLFFLILTEKIFYYDKEKYLYHRSYCPYLSLMVLCESEKNDLSAGFGQSK